MSITASTIPPDGPYYDDLSPGHVFDRPPAVTVDSGTAAAYQAIAGEALPLVLDRRLALAVTGRSERLVSPGLVLHLSIGASTVATKRVIANLFYRDVRLRRPVFEGETLQTTTRVVAMADGASKEGRAPRGKALLGIVTTADDEPILDYQRCPLIRCRGDELPGFSDELGRADGVLDLESWVDAVPQGWDLTPMPVSTAWEPGEQRSDPLRDVVDGATSLVRLTHNLASVHRDAEASPYPERLVYGGHTVALAQASLSRLIPGIVTVVGWHSCDHTSAVFEQDLLSFRHTMVGELVVHGGRLRAVRTVVSAHRPDGPVDVLDWVVLLFTT